jgi:hypothetical protein
MLSENKNRLRNINLPEDFEHITGEKWQQLEPEAQERYLELAFQFWRNHGFPYRTFTQQEICVQFQQLLSINSNRIFLSENNLASFPTGLALANYFHPQIWEIPFSRHRTPVQCFYDDDLLKACLKQALLLWPDRKGTSDWCLRDILRTFRHTRRVSNFRPTVAKALYENYSKPGDKILDFSAGFSGRLLGSLSLERHYVGYDPCQLQIDGLIRTFETLRDLELTKGMVELRKVCAEEEMLLEKDREYNLIFSSPPYFNCERYSIENTQSFIRYPYYEMWREKFLNTVIRESYRLLKTKGFFIINVANIFGAPIASDTKLIASSYFKLCAEYSLRLGKLPYHRSNNGSYYHYEPIYVFQKN